VISQSRQFGVTLIELVVGIAVLAILATLAAPSFVEFAERQALRGAVDNISAAVATAKEEAIKRDSRVRVDFRVMGAAVCIGATTDIGGCDCSAAACPLVTYPERERDLKRVTLVGTPVFGTDTGFVIDPKTGALEELSDAGAVELGTSKGYGATLRVNAMGRVSLCTPAGRKGLSGVATC